MIKHNVLHIGSIVTSNPHYNQKVIDVNVEGIRNIVELCLKTPVIVKMVYCSSTGAISDQPKGVAIKECDHYDDSLLPGCYAKSKAMATQLVLDAFHNQGLKACVVMPRCSFKVSFPKPYLVLIRSRLCPPVTASVAKTGYLFYLFSLIQSNQSLFLICFLSIYSDMYSTFFRLKWIIVKLYY